MGSERLDWHLREYIDLLMGAPLIAAIENSLLPPTSSSRASPAVVWNHHELEAGTWRAAIEPLLQHHGIRTRRLDSGRDNIWIRLVVAFCHHQVNNGGHAYHRSVKRQEGNDAKLYITVAHTGKVN